jgi:hypothetical protein
MIIGVNGRINSGKDTVGKIIQYLLCKNVGDVSIEEILDSNEHDWWLEEQSGFEIKKFANKLKQIASILCGVPLKYWENQDFKNEKMPEDWGVMTYREFLQRLGTDVIRDGLDSNVWVNALFSDYKPQKLSEYNPSRWIITDMRFPNEMKAVKERKGITIRVSRTGIHTPKVEDLHPSETSLDDAEFNYHIDNSGTIEDLVEKVKEILIKENINGIH